MASGAELVERTCLWKRTLAANLDQHEADRERLRVAFLSFRSRVALLVSEISHELPGLTVHDITHIDSLWNVADEIIGDDYPMTPAEAFVLGSAFLLHDAAHSIAAYEGGKSELRKTVQWKDFVAVSLNGVDPSANSPEERLVLFHVLRNLHAQQAERLPFMSWRDSSGHACHLLEDVELRGYYGQVIGLVAASHHWDAEAVAERLRHRKLSSPGFLLHSRWSVDVLKLAMILRVADAAHVDARRAPWFLFALKSPSGISKSHWEFQSRLAKPERLSNGELKISSGQSFAEELSEAWWLAWDVAQMVNRELKAAQRIMVDEGRPTFAVHGVSSVGSASEFSREVPVEGWEPVDVRAKISDVPYLIERLGGAALYGQKPEVAIRELLQNSLDACNASRHLVGDGPNSILVKLKPLVDDCWILSITDSGIGMSKHVLTDVLLDFGRSLWTNEVSSEFPGLASSGFRAVGKFGIGFYSVFMLGDEVSVVTRRYERASADSGDQLRLHFDGGLRGRPTLMAPKPDERLVRSGTEVAVKLDRRVLTALLGSSSPDSGDEDVLKRLCSLVGRLVPAAQVDVEVAMNGFRPVKVIAANDWKTISSEDLLSRLGDAAGKLLHPIYDENGELIGRLMPEPFWTSNTAVGTLNGIASMEVPGLVGLMTLSGNNTTAVRTDALLYDRLASWEAWAKLVVRETPRMSRHTSLSIHPLVPDEDLFIWAYRGRTVNLAELSGMVADEDEVILHAGEISYENDDDVGSFQFDTQFEPIEELLTGPDGYYQYGDRGAMGNGRFPWTLGCLRMDYRARVEKALEMVWGGVIRREGDVEVGMVGETAIIRRATLLRRPPPPDIAAG